MSAANVVPCLSELFDIDLSLKITKISQKQRLIAQRLAEIINSHTNCDQFHHDAEVTLDLVNDLDDYYYDNDIVGCDSDGNGSNDEWDNEEDTKENYRLNNYSIEFMKEVIGFADAKDSSEQAYICRFRQYVAQQETKRQKTQDIDKAVHQKFLKAREQYLPIHNIDIQRCGLQAAREVTNIVTKKEIINFGDIKKSKIDFLEKFHRLSKEYSRKEILSMDQVGIEKELHSTRTLSFQGEKKTLGCVASKNATVHSYTIQPTISLNGELIGPMYVCLQEPNGGIGDIVKRHLFQPKNVVITCSVSGKVTSSLDQYWRDNVLVPSTGEKVLLLSDSWSGQNDDDIYTDLKSIGKAIHRIQIPLKNNI
ncbi:unnamed protein product [Rotaria sp. Silwood2]|nr:unnamed protein product [Rotaria sp. Silwood2]CAF4198378.1 unnamed protein product [Rotaria sp. Silwood2]CAF4215137.1 unnamed protein product [Rotaria sp. Silwood2]CAF4313814.1 unnamed protein product [Rotaria sp. Silwood2]